MPFPYPLLCLGSSSSPSRLPLRARQVSRSFTPAVWLYAEKLNQLLGKVNTLFRQPSADLHRKFLVIENEFNYDMLFAGLI